MAWPAVRCAGPLPFAVVVEITSKVTTAARTARESVPGRTATSHEREQGARADRRSRLTTCSQLRHGPGAVPIAGWPEFHRENPAGLESLALVAQRDPCGTAVAGVLEEAANPSVEQLAKQENQLLLGLLHLRNQHA